MPMPTMFSAAGLKMMKFPSASATTTPSLMLSKTVSMSWV